MTREMDRRVRKAFSAMKSIGILPDKVKPVLKNLLKLYDKNWELIEEDNYRTLADAIFEQENDEKVKKNDVLEPEPPYKKPRGATLEDQGSTTLDNFSKIIDFEEGEIPQHSNKQRLAESSQSFSVNPRGVNSGSIPDEGCVDEAILHKKTLKVHEIRHLGNAINPERTPPLNCPPFPALPSSNVSSDEHNQPVRFPCNYQASLQYTFDIASSSCGQVKICLRR